MTVKCFAALFVFFCVTVVLIPRYFLSVDVPVSVLQCLCLGVAVFSVFFAYRAARHPRPLLSCVSALVCMHSVRSGSKVTMRLVNSYYVNSVFPLCLIALAACYQIECFVGV